VTFAPILISFSRRLNDVRIQLCGRDNQSNREWQFTTRLPGRGSAHRMAGAGREDEFPRPKLSDRCRFRKRPSAADD
jgi:hypothetical protein